MSDEGNDSRSTAPGSRQDRRGSLTVVGTGIKVWAHLTEEALNAIRRAEKVHHAVADTMMRARLHELNPSAERLPDYLPGRPRLETYDLWTDIVLGSVRAGLPDLRGGLWSSRCLRPVHSRRDSAGAGGGLRCGHAPGDLVGSLPALRPARGPWALGVAELRCDQVPAAKATVRHRNTTRPLADQGDQPTGPSRRDRSCGAGTPCGTADRALRTRTPRSSSTRPAATLPSSPSNRRCPSPAWQRSGSG